MAIATRSTVMMWQRFMSLKRCFHLSFQDERGIRAILFVNLLEARIYTKLPRGATLHVSHPIQVVSWFCGVSLYLEPKKRKTFSSLSFTPCSFSLSNDPFASCSSSWHCLLSICGCSCLCTKSKGRSMRDQL